MGWLIALSALLLAGLLAVSLGAFRQRRRAHELAVENSRWRALAQERADRVAVVSHEVRTPLALISGAC